MTAATRLHVLPAAQGPAGGDLADVRIGVIALSADLVALPPSPLTDALLDLYTRWLAAHPEPLRGQP